MKKHSVGVLLIIAVVLVLSLALVAAASAATLTGFTPTTASNTGSQLTLRINGTDLGDFIGTPDVELDQNASPYDVIYGQNVSVTPLLGGGYITCTIDPYLETPGTYTVWVGGYTLLGGYEQWISAPGSFTVTGNTPQPTSPTIASISPKTKVAGSGDFLLTVYGYDFSAGIGVTSQIMWNDQALVTTVVNSGTQLSATVPGSYIASAGAAYVSVKNTILGSPSTIQVSNLMPFVITAVTPTLTAVSPTSGFARYYQPYQLVLTGTNFLSTAQVLVNGNVHAATYVSATQMTMQLTANDIAAPGTLNISVRNGSGQQPTNTVGFTLAADTAAPVTTISGADTNWHNQPVALTVSATDTGGPGVLSTYYGIGVPPSVVLSGSTITVPAGNGAPQGPQLVQVYSVDKCNNTETPPKSVTVNICTTGPQTDCIAPASVKKGKTLKINWQADSITPTCTSTMKIYKSNNSVAKSFNLGTQNSSKTYTKSFTCNLAPGKYKVKVFSTDAAGNAQSSMQSDSFSVTK
jgi:hypothetical protein